MSVLIRADISLSAIAHNISELRSVLSPSAKEGLIAVVKADGYGHGSVPVSQTAIKCGVRRLAVARIEEGAHIREAGIKEPVLVFGYTPRDKIPELVRHDLTQTVFDYEYAKDLSDTASKYGCKIGVHLKIDTGMGRVGLRPSSLDINDIKKISALPGIFLEGIYTHFASADSSDKRYCLNQFQLFKNTLTNIKNAGINIPLRHAANSAGIIDLPETHLDAARAGIALYGLYPSAEVNSEKVDLLPAMALKTTIVHLKTVPKGTCISYGSTWKAERETTVATVAAGYADGLSRQLSSKGEMLVHGKRASVIGRVCMDQTMLDVSHIENVKTGDEAVIFGKQDDEEIRVEEIAEHTNTINYEVVSTITARVPRFYN